MKKMLWIVTTICLAGSNLYGQSLTDFTVSVFGGGSFLSAERSFIVDGDGFKTEFESGPKFGFRVGTGLSERWGIEGTYGYGRQNLRVTEMETPPEMRVFNIYTHQLSGNALYYVSPAENWKPFITGGLGVTRFSPTQEATTFAAMKFLDDPARIQADNKLSVNFGGGAQARINNWFGIRADVRDHMIQVPRFGLRETSSGTGGIFYPIRGWGHNMEFSVGAMFSIPVR